MDARFRGIAVFIVISSTLLAEFIPGGPFTFAQLPQPENSEPSSSRFGAVESFFRPQDAAEAGLGWERIIFEWRYLQPDGPDDWQTDHVPDRWLADAQHDGRMVVGLIKNAPSWATGSDLLGAVPKGLDLPVDDPGNLWAAFVKRLVSYYADKWGIHHWIIYNEPDIRPEDTPKFEFTGTVEDYYQMVKVAYKTAKASDPQAVIHLAGFTFWQDLVHQREQYLVRFLRLAEADPEAHANNLFFDVLTVHVFAGTDSVWHMTQLFKSLPVTFGASKPVWINEFNIRVTADGDWPLKSDEPTVSLDEQASFLIQGTALALAAGAERIEVYKLYDNDVTQGYEAWGLIRADGTRRPGYYALQTASRYFNATVKAQRYSTLDATLVTLVQPDTTVYVLWNETDAPLRARVKASGADATLVSVIGQTEALKANERGNYELSLPPCTQPCFVHGEPRILIQPGDAQAVWLLKNQTTTRLN